MHNSPTQIANGLVVDLGIDGALETVREEIKAAHANGDNYQLSIWREVRQAL